MIADIVHLLHDGSEFLSTLLETVEGGGVSSGDHVHSDPETLLFVHTVL